MMIKLSIQTVSDGMSDSNGDSKITPVNEQDFQLFQLLGQLSNYSISFHDLSEREMKELEKFFTDEVGLGKWKAERLWCNYVDLDPWHRIAGTIDALKDVIGQGRIKSVTAEFLRKDPSSEEKISLLVLLDHEGVQLLSTSKVEDKQKINELIKNEWKAILEGKHP
jgi:hypothetical protein